MRRIILYIAAVFVTVYAIIAVISYKKGGDNRIEEQANIYKEDEFGSSSEMRELNREGIEQSNYVHIDKRFSQELESKTEYLDIVENIQQEATISEEAKYIYEHKELFSESLLKLASNRVDAIPFVYTAQEKRNLVEVSSGESYVLNRNLPLYIQWDPRWGYKFYEDYFAIIGCGPTTIAMIVSGYKDSIDPLSIMDNMVEKQYYLKDIGTSWEGMINQLHEMGMQVESIPLGEQTFKNVLNEGGVVLLSAKAGHFTTLGHYLVIAGIDEDGKFLINDPNSIRNSIRPWEYDEISNEIKGCWKVY